MAVTKNSGMKEKAANVAAWCRNAASKPGVARRCCCWRGRKSIARYAKKAEEEAHVVTLRLRQLPW